MRVARALANRLRTAWHDPIWALTAVLLAPIRAFRATQDIVNWKDYYAGKNWGLGLHSLIAVPMRVLRKVGSVWLWGIHSCQVTSSL